jgi:hypothetical protein
VPANQRPRTGLIPGTDDQPGPGPDNEQMTNLTQNLTDTTRPTPDGWPCGWTTRR